MLLNTILPIQQIDVEAAFLNEELVEEVYILPPLCLPTKGSALRLQQALYGLKQAANVWYAKWGQVLLGTGLKPTEVDPRARMLTINV
jgi:hypothetical protein